MNTGSPLRITIILPDAAPSPVGGFKVQYLYARELARPRPLVDMTFVIPLLWRIAEDGARRTGL